MGVAASTNHVLKFVALAVAVGASALLARSCSRDPASSGDAVNNRGLLTPGEIGADADTETETLRTLIGEVRRLREEAAGLEAQNAELSGQNQALQQMETRLSNQLETDLAAAGQDLETRQAESRRQASEVDAALARLESRIAALAAESSERGALVPGDDIPVGLGFDEYLSSRDEVIWIDPLDRPGSEGEGNLPVPGPVESLWNRVGGEPAGESDVTPVLTVPRNSTLVGARGFTALVGRIPVRGQVVDPFPFKVLVGADNLAANGFEMPALFGMVFSGTAIGDWTLSCVRGEVTSVTYILNDGSIQSYPEGDAEAEQERPIGWISDPFGVPCITGERKTNAQSFLSQRIGLSAAAAAADAAASAQTTTTVAGASGAVTRAVTGDINTFIRQRTIAEGINEVATWLNERQAQSFDAVFVPPNSELVVHVTRELAIDHDLNGRKVNHDVSFDANPIRPLD